MTPSNPVKISFEKAFKDSYINFLKFNFRHLRLIPFFIKTIYYQKKGVKIRKLSKANGIETPAILAISITSKCNLDCTGCYYKSQNRKFSEDLSDGEITRLIREAHDLGIRTIMFLGGEPMIRDVFGLTSEFNDMIFILFTNSTLINDKAIQILKKRKNIIPLLSLEGYSQTDKRRGNGIWENIKHTSKVLKEHRILYGLSYTVTRENFNEVINNEVIKTDIENGSFWLNFFEYVPIDPQTRHLMITKEQKDKFREFVFSFRRKYKTHIFSPVLETNFICGCSGARHIAHITSDGNLEPCPFIQHSDTSVLGIELKEAFKSRFFSQIRTHLPNLEEIDGHSCKLFTHKEWIIKTLEEGNLIKLRKDAAEKVGYEQR